MLVSLQALLVPLERGCLYLSGEVLVSLRVVLSSLRWQLVPLRRLLQCFFDGFLFSLEEVLDSLWGLLVYIYIFTCVQLQWYIYIYIHTALYLHICQYVYIYICIYTCIPGLLSVRCLSLGA